MSDDTGAPGAPGDPGAPGAGDPAGPADTVGGVEDTPLTSGAALARDAVKRTLDVIVYAPAGFVVDAIDRAPAMAELGRARILVQLSNARLMGDFVLHKAARDLRRRMPSPPGRRPSGSASASAPETGAPLDDDRLDDSLLEPSGSGASGGSGGSGTVSLPSDRATTAAAGAAIEGYDTLSASQVVRRLDGLGPDELRAVYRHEAATRGRRTILHRVQQLLDPASAPAPVAPAAAAPAAAAPAAAHVEAHGSGNGNGSGAGSASGSGPGSGDRA